MTTTDLYSGYTADGKPSSRILQPPGGGSSNIFGTNDEPQQQQRQQVREAMPPQQNNHGAAAGAGETRPPPQRRHPDGASVKADAPFASFDESGKKSSPNQFNNCSSSSQNEADFRSYSVSAYKDAVEQNAVVKQRARGQAAGSFNPITHEEGDDKNSMSSHFRDYEQARPHPAAESHSSQQRRVAAPRDAGKVTYNPITGEEYPASYGQNENENEDSKPKPTETEATPTEQSVAPPTEQATPAPDETEVTPTEQSVAPPTEQATPAPVPGRPPPHTSTRVRQPPGGASSGPLW